MLMPMSSASSLHVQCATKNFCCALFFSMSNSTNVMSEFAWEEKVEWVNHKSAEMSSAQKLLEQGLESKLSHLWTGKLCFASCIRFFFCGQHPKIVILGAQVASTVILYLLRSQTHKNGHCTTSVLLQALTIVQYVARWHCYFVGRFQQSITECCRLT